MSIRTLYELADFQNGRAFKPSETSSESGWPVIKIAEMNRGFSEKTGIFNGPVESRHMIRTGDLLFAWSGSIVVQRYAGPDAVLNQHIFKVTAKPGVGQRYMQYLLESLVPTFELIVLDQKTTMGHVKVSDLKRIQIQVPDEPEQEAIADVLRSLDDKVAANARIVRLADELSAANFQAASRDGEKVPLSSMARFVNGRAYTKNATGTGRVVVRIAELTSGIGASTVRNDIEVPDDNTARPGDLLFAWSGSLTTARWYRPEAIVNQHIFKVLPNSGTPMWLVNEALHSKLGEFKAIAADKATTMGHIQRHHLDEPVRIPAAASVKKLDDLMTSLWDAALAAEIQNLKLATTRDELLPLLLSGKVRVKDAGKSVEGVL